MNLYLPSFRPNRHRRICLAQVYASAALLVGCSGTTWTHARTAPDYQPSKHIAVAILVEVAGEGVNEAAQELRESLANELRSSGIVATFVDREPARPSAELRVVQWDMGDRWKRYCWLKEGQGHIVVTVRVTSADGRPGYYGVARGRVDGGFFWRQLPELGCRRGRIDC
jgi:ABC-type phosphate/phosphonate transport system substrate-binding protein